MDPQRKLLREALAELRAGRPVVRAVIVRTWGSTPRETGADMIMDLSGGLSGTVGGGCGEAEVYELAQELLHDPKAEGSVLHVDLTENPDEGGGKVCGGRLDVLLHRLEPSQHLAVVERAEQLLSEGKPILWQTGLGEFRPGFWKDGLSQVEVTPVLSVRLGALESPSWQDESFCEPLGASLHLVIVGAGHIARPLASMASQVGYAVSVLDDRAEYAQSESFPQAHEVVCGAYEVELVRMAQRPRTSVVLVTRGHKHDQDCLRLIASCPLDYIGMIGSQRRIDAVFAELVEEGISRQVLEGVCAPVGLEIGAQTPAEIAVSILAEMIMGRRQGLLGRQPKARIRHQKSLRSC